MKYIYTSLKAGLEAGSSCQQLIITSRHGHPRGILGRSPSLATRAMICGNHNCTDHILRGERQELSYDKEVRRCD
jgi:hypothetical protein